MVLYEITEGSVITYTYEHELIRMNSGEEGIRYYLSDGHDGYRDISLSLDSPGLEIPLYLGSIPVAHPLSMLTIHF